MNKKITVKFCPKCKSEVAMVAGGHIGLYECKRCGFRGSVFPEKQILNKKTKKNGR